MCVPTVLCLYMLYPTLVVRYVSQIYLSHWPFVLTVFSTGQVQPIRSCHWNGDDVRLNSEPGIMNSIVTSFGDPYKEFKSKISSTFITCWIRSGLVQDGGISIPNKFHVKSLLLDYSIFSSLVMEVLQSCVKPSTWYLLSANNWETDICDSFLKLMKSSQTHTGSL